MCLHRGDCSEMVIAEHTPKYAMTHTGTFLIIVMPVISLLDCLLICIYEESAVHRRKHNINSGTGNKRSIILV